MWIVHRMLPLSTDRPRKEPGAHLGTGNSLLRRAPLAGPRAGGTCRIHGPGRAGPAGSFAGRAVRGSPGGAELSSSLSWGCVSHGAQEHSTSHHIAAPARPPSSPAFDTRGPRREESVQPASFSRAQAEGAGPSHPSSAASRSSAFPGPRCPTLDSGHMVTPLPGPARCPACRRARGTERRGKDGAWP